jgi:hypothetical protein
MMGKYVSVIAVGGLLLAACLFPIFRANSLENSARGSLADLLPRDAPGWVTEDVPLAASEVGVDIVKTTLNYDGYVFRRYSQGNKVFDIYIAFWQARKVPVSMVAAHTPDVCWVGAGWVPVASRSGEALQLARGATIPGEWRCFRAPSGQERDVWFWHIGRRAVYQGNVPVFAKGGHLLLRLRDLWSEVCGGVPDQYFVRISTNHRFEAILQEEVCQTVLEAVRRRLLIEE